MGYIRPPKHCSVIILLFLVLYILWRDLASKPVAAKEIVTATDAFLTRAPTPDRTRLRVIGLMTIGLYAMSIPALYVFWYRKSKISAFHWFDDIGEWNQMDKAGHIFSAYFETVYAYELLRWSGVDNKKAALISAATALTIQGSMEGMDGMSSKYGASRSDLGANLIGALIAASQYLLWEEQRIMLKYSYSGGSYPAGELGERASELFGENILGQGIKDYNHINLWASVNPSKFYPGAYPKWLCFSVGYGSENLYGGFENKWIDKDNQKHDRSDLPRMRVVKFSLDADLPQLSDGSKKELALFKALNVFKVPFPSIQHKWEAARSVNPNPNGWGRDE